MMPPVLPLLAPLRVLAGVVVVVAPALKVGVPLCGPQPCTVSSFHHPRAELPTARQTGEKLLLRRRWRRLMPWQRGSLLLRLALLRGTAAALGPATVRKGLQGVGMQVPCRCARVEASVGSCKRSAY